MRILELLKTNINFNRVIFYFLSFLIIISLSTGIYIIHKEEQARTAGEKQRTESGLKMISLIKQYGDLSTQVEEAKKIYPQIDLKSEESLLLELKNLILSNNYIKAKKSYDKLQEAINNKIADEKTKGILSGKSADGSTAVVATIQIFQGETQLTEIQSLPDGTFSYWLFPDKYTIKANASGYSEFAKDFEIKTGETTDVQISLQKIKVSKTSAAVSPKPVPETNASDGIYSKENINTDRGSFAVYLLRVDLNQYEMRVDTAADGDCENDCPVKSLSSYVTQNGGFAGIHGTYFCPTSYTDCAGKTNSFYYKMYNFRLDKKINWTNGLGDYLPFLSIDQSGQAHYYSSWSSVKDSVMRTGISCRPHLVENSEIVLTDGDMDSDKERYSKISHGFIGIKGQVIYAGIVMSANLPDSAAVVKALGVENAFNIDGGGTSAMYYNGSYKVGPGRDMPNAIVFVRK